MNIPDSIITISVRAHEQGKALVLATGVFDLLHTEHINFLKKAKAAGDVLIVGIESDVRVKQLKGEGRPVESEESRKQKVESVVGVDGVFILPEDFTTSDQHMELLQILKPDILAVSSHTPHLEGKQRLMSLIGGRVEVVLEHNPEVSTTKLIEEQRALT